MNPGEQKLDENIRISDLFRISGLSRLGEYEYITFYKDHGNLLALRRRIGHGLYQKKLHFSEKRGSAAKSICLFLYHFFYYSCLFELR